MQLKAYKYNHLNSHVVDWGINFQTSLKKFLSKAENQLHEKISVPSWFLMKKSLKEGMCEAKAHLCYIPQLSTPSSNEVLPQKLIIILASKLFQKWGDNTTFDPERLMAFFQSYLEKIRMDLAIQQQGRKNSITNAQKLYFPQG